MINYSIVMRSVNANLLEINQAKSRINQAKKDGKEPEKKDTDLVKTEKQNAFAISQYTDVMTIEKFAKHITSHGSVYSRADISAILYMAVDCMREMLLEGKKIRLGDLGDFSILLASKGAETADKFTAQNITNVKVQWEPGQQFKNLLDDAEFNLVASRSAQAAVIKAIKEGKTNVDLNVPINPDGGGDGAGTQGGGSNTGGSGTTGTEGSGTQGAGGSGTTGTEGSGTQGAGGSGTTGTEGSGTQGAGGSGTTGTEGSGTQGAGGSGTTGTEGSGTQGAGGSGTTGDQGTSGGNTGSEGGGDDNVSL